MRKWIYAIDTRDVSLYYVQVIAPRWISLRASGGVILCPQGVGS